jgi:hypothetical protein
MATLGEIVEANAAERDAITDRRDAERERSRTKKQRQRERQREKARLLAIAEAERMELEAARRERLDEKLAPAVLRQPVIGADGRMIVGPRVQIIDGRPVRMPALGIDSDPIAKLARDSRVITERHHRAFRRLQQEWHDVGTGLGSGAVDYLRAGGGREIVQPPGHEAMKAQIETRQSLEGAVRFLGSFWPIVFRIAIDCVSLPVWWEEENLRRAAKKQSPMAKQNVLAWLGAAADRLVLYYFPPRSDGGRGPGLLTFGPGRETYDTSVADVEGEIAT